MPTDSTPHAILGLVRELVDDFTRRHGKPPMAIILSEAERAAFIAALGMGGRGAISPDVVFHYQGIEVLCTEHVVRLSGICAWHGPEGQKCIETATSGDLCRRHRAMVELAHEPLMRPRPDDFKPPHARA